MDTFISILNLIDERHHWIIPELMTSFMAPHGSPTAPWLSRIT